jgi:aspartate aminotransferase
MTQTITRASASSSRLNRFLERSEPSATYRVIDRIVEKRTSGESVISLCAGEPDFDTPAHISAAAIDAIKSGYTRYTQVAGMKALRQAVANKFQEDNDIPVNRDETIVCTGGKQVLFNALAATLNENDEVIIPAPFWVSYPEMVEVCGGKPITIPGEKGNAFKLTPEALDNAITPRTKWLILNSPSNPTGAVYSKDELLSLAEILRKHTHVMVLSDDIYEHLIFDGLSFHTMTQVAPDLKDRVLTMNGVSKAYAMTGWRIGFGTGPKWLIEAMTKLQGQQTSGACSISQHAALAALEGPKDFIHISKAVFLKRRDLAVKMLNKAPGLSCEIPSGAFYIFADCTRLLGKTTPGGNLIETDEDVANALLEEMNVAVVHGSAFGVGPYLRIAYALDDESLKLACERIQTFCGSLFD